MRTLKAQNGNAKREIDYKNEHKTKQEPRV